MNCLREFFFVLFLGINAILCAQQGHLIIAGGGLQEDNSEVFNEIVRLSGGRSATIGIIPAASGSPVQSYEAFKKILMKYGLAENQIQLIRIASEDDNVTEEDEALWMNNAYDSSTCRRIRECKGIWFSGGDQMRVTRVLLTSEGKDTPALKAIRSVLFRGGMVGGTSAGAAIQSKVMIGGGTSIGALLYGVAEVYSEEDVDGRGKLFWGDGLGFFQEGIVDQHFDRRARLGRLTVALLHKKINIGVGIDENTALVYNLKSCYATVIGKGGVSIVDVSSAEMQMHEALPEIRKCKISYLTSGDSVSFMNFTITPASDKVYIVGKESNHISIMPSSGLLAGVGYTISSFIFTYLIDNKNLKSVSNITYTHDGWGYRMVFYIDNTSYGFMADRSDEEKCSFGNVWFDLIPLIIREIEIK